MANVLSRPVRHKSPGVNGLPNELYFFMSGLFAPVVAVIYFTRSIRSRLCLRVVTLLKEDLNKRHTIENFWPTTLLNTEFKISAKVFD